VAPHLVLCIGLTEGDESVSMSGKTLYRVLFMARDHSAVHEQVCAFVWRWNGIVVHSRIEGRQYKWWVNPVLLCCFPFVVGSQSH